MTSGTAEAVPGIFFRNYKIREEQKMNLSFTFFFNSILLGVGLAMDAFSVSLANGLGEPKMKKPKMAGVAGIFSLFQFAMPLIGWICVATIAQYFAAFEKCIPWIFHW